MILSKKFRSILNEEDFIVGTFEYKDMSVYDYDSLIEFGAKKVRLEVAKFLFLCAGTTRKKSKYSSKVMYLLLNHSRSSNYNNSSIIHLKIVLTFDNSIETIISSEI